MKYSVVKLQLDKVADKCLQRVIEACLDGRYRRAVEFAGLAVFDGDVVKDRYSDRALLPLPIVFPTYVEITINQKPLAEYVG